MVLQAAQEAWWHLLLGRPQGAFTNGGRQNGNRCPLKRKPIVSCSRCLGWGRGEVGGSVLSFLAPSPASLRWITGASVLGPPRSFLSLERVHEHILLLFTTCLVVGLRFRLRLLWVLFIRGVSGSPSVGPGRMVCICSCVVINKYLRVGNWSRKEP